MIFNQFDECIFAYSTNFSIHISLLWNIFSFLDFQTHLTHANQITLTRFENVLNNVFPLPINPSNWSRCNTPLCNAVDIPSQWKIAYPTPAKVGQAKFNICSNSLVYSLWNRLMCEAVNVPCWVTTRSTSLIFDFWYIWLTKSFQLFSWSKESTSEKRI